MLSDRCCVWRAGAVCAVSALQGWSVTEERAYELACGVAMYWNPQTPQRLTILLMKAILAAIEEDRKGEGYRTIRTSMGT